MNLIILKETLFKTLNSFKQFLPIILGIVMLMGLSMVAIPKSFYTTLFTGNKLIDPLFGAILGSVASGNPITSYIIGGELLKQGVSLIAITAFILAWVSVGIIQLPAESVMLGRKFAIIRNAVSFATALVIAIFTILTLSLI